VNKYQDPLKDYISPNISSVLIYSSMITDKLSEHIKYTKNEILEKVENNLTNMRKKYCSNNNTLNNTMNSSFVSTYQPNFLVRSSSSN